MRILPDVNEKFTILIEKSRLLLDNKIHEFRVNTKLYDLKGFYHGKRNRIKISGR